MLDILELLDKAGCCVIHKKRKGSSADYVWTAVSLLDQLTAGEAEGNVDLGDKMRAAIDIGQRNARVVSQEEARREARLNEMYDMV